MGRLQRIWTAVILVATCLFAEGLPMFASDQGSIEQVLAAGQEAMLARRYRQAVHIFQSGLRIYPQDSRLQLELGRAYLANRADSRAIRLFYTILKAEPDNRTAKLELARALGYDGQYEHSDEIYKELLEGNPADETAAIGLSSNLLHQQRSSESHDVINKALAFHPNSLRLQEYKDRIESGRLGGEEREPLIVRNLFATDVDYINDSSGNHSWRSSQHLDFGLRPGLTTRLLLEQRIQHGLDDPFEAVETFSVGLRWRLRDSLLFSGGGGTVRFNDASLHPIYDGSLVLRPMRKLLLGAAFSRVPIIPDAEATEQKLTAQGWEAFAIWTPAKWQITANWSRRHYSDGNIGNHQSAEILREWSAKGMTFTTGYGYGHYSFEQRFAHGYFSPSNYQSHLGLVGVRVQPGRKYRAEFLVRGGQESPAADSDFRTAWEINARNQVLLGNWTLELEYSKYHLAQETGAFRADAGRFAFTYRF